MTVTVYAKYEIFYSDEQIEDMKKDYNKSPEDCYNLSDKNEFIESLYDEIYEYSIDEIIVKDDEGYSDFCQKWNKM